MNFKLTKTGVRRLDDGAFIPNDPDNLDWKAFLAWQAAGNVPQPVDPDPAPIDFSDADNQDKVFKAMLILIAQLTSTPLATVKAQFRTIYRQLP